MPTLVLAGNCCIAATSAFWVISHFDGFAASDRFGSLSQVSESVVGGGLQFMLPLRSSTNKRFDGNSSDCTVATAQLPFRMLAALSAGKGGALGCWPAPCAVVGAD